MSEYEPTSCLVINLFSCTAKGSVAPFCAKIRYKICNDHRGDNQLPDTCVFLDCLLDIAYIADNSMDFSSVSRVNRWKFAYQTFDGQTASGKYISGVTIRDFQSKAERNFDNISGF